MLRRLLRVARQRWRALFQSDEVDTELSRELSFHLDQLTQEYVERGLSERDARLAARRAIGNIPLIEEQSRDTRSVAWLLDLRQDVLHGVRMLRRNPGFTIVALASLALGIGANTAILSVLDTVMRDRLPIPRDDRVVVVRTYPLDDPSQETHARIADYFAWRDENQSFAQMGAAMGNNADFGADAGAGAPAERIGGQSITAESLAALGVQPLLGRLFNESDESAVETAPTRVIILSHQLWQRRFFGRPDIIGQPVRLDRINRTIIGVMPETFQYPNEQTRYWIPLHMDRSQQRNPQRFFVVTARLREGVSIEQAQSEMDAIATRRARTNPEQNEGWGVRVKPVREAMFGWTRGRLYTLEAAILLVLLVACANVAGLLLARGLVRGPEIALRSALGASRGRIVRQLLTESVLLSSGGGLLGLLVAWAGVRTLVTMNPPPGGVAIADVALSLRMLGATGAMAILTGLLYGIAPALVHARASLTDTLKAPAGGGTRHPRLRSVLVAAQIAVTMVLLIGSGLLMKSFVRVMSRDLRFDPAGLLTFDVRIPIGDYLQRRGTIAGLPYFEITPPPSIAFERMYRGLRAIPGAESVAGVSTQLVNSLVVPSATISLEARPARGSAENSGASASFAIGVGANATHLDERRSLIAAYFLVTPDFFTSIRSPKIRGRDFNEGDTGGSEWVAIINESAARRFWPDADPLGQVFTIVSSPADRPRKVIGIVRDIPLTLEGDYRPAIYTSYLQQPSMTPSTGAGTFGQMVFMIRSGGDPMSLLPAARRVVADVEPDRPLASVATMEQRLRFVLPQRGYVVFAITAFALTATLLAAIGIYGVMAYSVTQRTREIGIRVALGAAAHEVIALVGRRTVFIVALGLGTGLAGALAATQLLQSQLWGVTPTDPATFVLVSLAFAFVALAAAFFPMRRAMAVDPTIALRCE